MDKVKRRFVGEMLYGIQAAKDIKVSEIARSLGEEIALIKTENRLCRNLADEDMTERINRWTAWEGSGAVQEDTVLALDLGDVRKSYAKKMEYLGYVHDGSTGEIAPGSSDIVSPSRPKHLCRRHIGGQEGHAPHFLPPFASEEVDAVLDHRPDRCPHRGGTLEPLPDALQILQQADLPERPVVATEHCVYRC